ncbi:twin-arginine translocation signal domain-containing protein [Parasedimentitalea marina]|uniref:Twin-arginine translocation signal domain-containing protein n=1 Tax=Parasedimentitalea marina TaxID=2483033 RepID=A0A3T0N1Y1_9RHOB|nr:cyclase family protein [Parasedimentitalea marina]AZV77997.1 twin-arginine translocation signal domain-containing protein [Parasedimentitalea marina]
MCDICVINSVKERMLSRRDFFKASAAVGATATIGGLVAAPAAMASGHDSVVDMSHKLSEEFPTYFGKPGFSKKQVFNFRENGFNLFELSINEHTATHIDAPLHFSADGASVDEIPVGDLIIPLCVIHIHEKAANDPDAQVTPDDLKAWIAKNGPIPDKACVAMHSDWDAKIGTDAFRGADAEGVMHFPGFHVEAAQMLLEETTAAAMAVDTLSLDHGMSTDFATHYAWLPAGRYGIENLAGLTQVPEAGATLVVGAPTHKGGSGGPARIFAMV